MSGLYCQCDGVYQLYKTSRLDRVCLAVRLRCAGDAHTSPIFSFPCVSKQEVEVSGNFYFVTVYDRSLAPERIGDIPMRLKSLQEPEILHLASELAKMKQCSWSNSLYFRSDGVCIGFGRPESKQERSKLGMRLLTGGVEKLSLSEEEIQAVNSSLSIPTISKIICTLEILRDDPADILDPQRPDRDFSLPGYPSVEKVFQERVIRYYRNREKYEKLNVKPINGILLYGPPGSGKTYAVRRLVEHLKWPLIEISVGEQGSKYIHETSNNFRDEFLRARRKAPSVIFLDEIDAIGISRSLVDSHHKLEEVSELLRQMDSIGQGNVVVVAATNQIDKIDPALKRKGRFDLLVEVPFPDHKGLVAVLRNCMSMRPHVPKINFVSIAQQLENFSAADIENLVNEAGRIAVDKGLSKISEGCLREAIRDNRI